MLERVMTSRPDLGHRLVGWFAIDSREGERNYLGSWDEVRDVVKRYQIDVVMVVMEDESRQILAQGLTACEGLNVEFLYVPSISSAPHGQVKMTELEGIPLLKMKGVAIQGWNAVVKRAFDIVFSLGALVMLSPLLLLVGLLVKLSSPGPLFYKQERVGLDGIKFDCLKFRSMRMGAESQTGPVWATKGDARVTGIGKIIRRLSIDELPQLWNVLRGDMSIVGPRPERPHFVSQFEERVPGYVERHRVRSGLTGWAQVNGWRGDTSIEIRTQYDLYYVENWSLGFDLQIILRTFTEVFFGKNAY
jgi:exopolysaccharide biosynthesis polyprenyl glycosylphosphotransferase